MSGSEIVPLLELCRRAEKEQALFYRALAARAEAAGSSELAQRFHDRHADEQHHLSRLSARITELGRSPEDLSSLAVEPVPLEAWEPATRTREAEEVRMYERLLNAELDDRTRELVEEILEVERAHAADLGGKWTPA